MAKVVCVLYDDPVDGYPTKYARKGRNSTPGRTGDNLLRLHIR